MKTIVDPRAEFLLYFDGACQPSNPGGYMGFGALVKSHPSGEVLYRHSACQPPHPHNTNNVAEYRALIAGLTWLFDQGHARRCVQVFGDSLMVINQMRGEWRAKSGLYFDAYADAVDLLPVFGHIIFTWVPRDQNTEADALSTKAINLCGTTP